MAKRANAHKEGVFPRCQCQKCYSVDILHNQNTNSEFTVSGFQFTAVFQQFDNTHGTTETKCESQQGRKSLFSIRQTD